jgi:hypothetical protein
MDKELIPCCVSVCICRTRLSGFFDKCYTINLIIRNYKTHEVAVLSKTSSRRTKKSHLLECPTVTWDFQNPTLHPMFPRLYRTFKASHQNILKALEQSSPYSKFR